MHIATLRSLCLTKMEQAYVRPSPPKSLGPVTVSRRYAAVAGLCPTPPAGALVPQTPKERGGKGGEEKKRGKGEKGGKGGEGEGERREGERGEGGAKMTEARLELATFACLQSVRYISTTL